MSGVYKATALGSYGLSHQDLVGLSYTIKKHRKYKTNMYIYNVDQVREVAKSKFRCTSSELQQIVDNQTEIQKRKNSLKKLKESIILQALECSNQRYRVKMLIKKKEEEIKKKSTPKSKRHQPDSSEDEEDCDTDEDYSQNEDDQDEPVAAAKPRVRKSKL